MAYDKGDEKTNQANQFLQLLNKDNNWVTFFIKSIIQDSAKKGYEKVLFPKGETAAKIEGHESVADRIMAIDNDIKKFKGFSSNLNSIEENTGYAIGPNSETIKRIGDKFYLSDYRDWETDRKSVV